jgi:hypothetical protein
VIGTPKPKKCRDKDCDAEFMPYLSTDKYCSHSCFNKNSKNAFDKEFDVARAQVQDNVVKRHGKLCCERCMAEKSILFSTHHIIYRTERPKHPSLNNLLNLIYLCAECHEWFHDKKIRRNYLIDDRDLTSLFGVIWGHFK